MNAQTQTLKLARWLLEHGSITPRDAVDWFQCWRLGARIHELRQELGDDVILTKPERHSRGTHARYVLDKPFELSLWLAEKENNDVNQD